MKLLKWNYEVCSLMKIKEYISVNNEKNIVAWGLSQKLKFILDTKKLMVDYIIDKNESIIGTSFNSIPIISFSEYKTKNNCVLIILGDHVESVLLELEKYNFTSKIFILDEDFPKVYKITPEYLKSDHNIEKKKKLFKKIVSLIEIEPHSYCNRTCWFCPNSFIDRRSNTNFMDINILKQLLKDLSSIDYDKKVAFTRYSEPFGNEIFYDRLNLVHTYLPRAILHANTNGDFLNNKTIEKAYDNGLRSLFIQVYLNKDESFNFKTVDKKAQKIIKRISDVQVELDFKRKDWVEYKCQYKDMYIRMYARDFKQNGINRSGIEVVEKKFFRTSPCTLVFTDVYIDFNSNIVPCCNIRSDNKEHENMSFGKITSKENSIFEVFFSKKALSWRKGLLNFDSKKMEPCLSCEFALLKENSFLKSFINNVTSK